MGRKCEVSCCSNRQGKTANKSFFHFPKNVNLCREWVSCCNSVKSTALLLNCGENAFDKRIICSDHFDSAAFRDSKIPKKGLMPSAIPSYNITAVKQDADSSLENLSSTVELEFIEDDTDFSEWEGALQISPGSVSPIYTEEASVRLNTQCKVKECFGESSQAVSQHNQSDICTTDDAQTPTGSSSLIHESLLLELRLNVEKGKVEKLKEEQKILKRRLFVSEQSGRRRLNSLQIKKRQITQLTKNLKTIQKQKTLNEKLGLQARKNIIIHDTLQNTQRKPKGRRYNLITMKFASGVYLSGPRTYRYLRNSNVLILPHKNSVHRHNRCVRISPGLNEPILEKIKNKVAKKLRVPREKNVVLCMDGMAVKPDLTYSANSDVFFGFPDDGVRRKFEKNDVMRLASEAVTVMVSGIYRKFKQPIGYLLAHNSLGSKTQYKLLEKSVRAVRCCGLIPSVFTMDQGSTNMKMVREAGVTMQKPFIKIDGHTLAVLYDAPHVIKNARNAIFKYNAVFDQKIASFSHLRKLLELDVKTGLRIVPKLSERVLDLPPFASMNVSLATRLLSETNAIGIQYYVQTGELPEEYLHTSEFLILHDKLFDIFNSRDSFADSIGKPYRSPLTPTSDHLKYLKKALPILKKMYFTPNTCFDLEKAKEESLKLKSTQRQPPFLKGFISNIYAVRWLWEKFKSEHYLCTNPLSQDCLENFFAEIRRRCGFNDAPNVFQFGSAFKYAMIAASDQNFVYGQNCQHDNANPFLTEDDLDELPASKQKKYEYDFEPIDLSKPFETNTKDMNVLVYVIGAAAHKLPHIKCRKNLIADRNDGCIDNEDYAYSKLKASLSKRSVTIPNSTLYAIGVLAFVCFKLKFRKFLYENRIGVKQRLKAYLDYTNFEDATCLPCFNKLVDCIFNTLIKSFLREVRLLRKVADKKKRGWNKRNRKAFRMNLPETKRPNLPKCQIKLTIKV